MVVAIDSDVIRCQHKKQNRFVDGGKEMSRKNIIGVFGGGNVVEDDWEWKTAKEVGERLAANDCIVLTGGLGGVMTAASKGAKEAGGMTIGILPGNRDATSPNRYVDIAVFTGMGEARNVINVRSCNAAIAIGGEYGTLSEIALALKSGCPLVLLDSWSFSRKKFKEGQEMLVARDAADAVQKVLAAIKRGADQ